MPFLAFVLACTAATPAGPVTPLPTPLSTPAPAMLPAANLPTRPARATGTLSESCEPSSLLSHEGEWIVGDNENPGQLYVFSPAFEPQPPRTLAIPVDDIEALAKYGEELVVVGSHSRNKNGKAKPERARILLTGSPDARQSDRLLPLNVSICPECVAAQALAPDDGGFNIEAAVTVGDQLALGLRSPVDAGRARLLLAALTGPTAGIVTEVKTYDLGGQGFREIVPWKAGYLIVAGPVADGGEHPLYWLPSLDSVATRIGQLPAGTESILPLDPNEVWYLVDGDGKPGECKTRGKWGMLSVTLP